MSFINDSSSGQVCPSANIQASNQMSNNYVKFMQPPDPINLNKNFCNFQLDDFTRLEYDPCAYRKEELESSGPGLYKLTEFDPHCDTNCDVGNRLNNVTHFPKHYSNPLCYADDENDLIFSKISNLNTINQLYIRPYKGMYAGSGTRSLGNKDLESVLQQGLDTTSKKACNVLSGRDTSSYRFNILPTYGNPQRVQHVMPPPVEVGGWVRGGDHTRDFVRRVDYQRRCLNRHSNNIIDNQHSSKY